MQGADALCTEGSVQRWRRCVFNCCALHSEAVEQSSVTDTSQAITVKSQSQAGIDCACHYTRVRAYVAFGLPYETHVLAGAQKEPRLRLEEVKEARPTVAGSSPVRLSSRTAKSVTLHGLPGPTRTDRTRGESTTCR